MTDTQRRRSAHSLERIEPSAGGVKGWRAFAGDLGNDLGHFRTKAGSAYVHWQAIAPH